jgi:hypothetical protein
MAPAKTTPKTTQDAALEALERRRARVADGLVPKPVTPEELAIASAMRERDHREGCPMTPGRIEAYDETVTAPGPDLRSMRVAAGDTIIVTRCHDCGMVRYFTGHVDVDAFIDQHLEALAGLEPAVPAEDELDGAL